MATAPDPLSFERAAARIGRILVVVSVLGTCGALAAGGWKSGAGFLLAAAILGLNYHWLQSWWKPGRADGHDSEVWFWGFAI